MYCYKIKGYCPRDRNKISYFDKTSILNENAYLEECLDCVYFFSKNCGNNLDM